MNILTRLYALSLYAYPKQFRRDFGPQMLACFEDGRGNRDWLALAWDWLKSVCVEHASNLWSAGRIQQPRGPILEWAITALVYLFASTTLLQAYVVPTGSMEGSLRVGDHMLVDRVAFSGPGHLLPYREVHHGDIVAFLYPEDVRQTYVKRVIGLPGDHIRMEHKQVVRNGQPLLEPYTQHIAPGDNSYRDNFPAPPDSMVTGRGLKMLQENIANGELVVPPNTLFVMGDNRENSLDSRYWGLVPRDYVVGRPLVVYWSYDAPTGDLQDWSLDHVLDVAHNFFSKTRWERTFLVPHTQEAQ